MIRGVGNPARPAFNPRNMKRILYKIRIAWNVLWSDSLIAVARRGDKVLHGMICIPTDPIVGHTMRMVAPVMIEAHMALEAINEAGQAVDKLKDEMGIPESNV